MQNMMLLYLFIIPLLMASLVLVIPARQATLKRCAILLSLAPLVFLLYYHDQLLGLEFKAAWLPALSINFHLRIDDLALIFLYLSALIIPISLVAVRAQGLVQAKTLYFLVLVLQALLIGFFTTRDLALFTVFWEALLLPLYFIILLWGGAQRQQAALKFLVFMIAGSALMVAAVLGLYFYSASRFSVGTFSLDDLQKITAAAPGTQWILLIFLLAFAVKTPLFPFHGWLSEAYCQAPTSGTILLSAILSKVGIYGFIRIGLELFPGLMQEWSPYLLALAVAGVFYGAFAAWQQQDFKRLIAYSSFSHVNFVLVGIFVWQLTAHSGAILQALNHGVSIAALFLVAGWLEERVGSSSMELGGVARAIPKLCWLSLIFVAAAIALPGSNNFIGEFIILNGMFSDSPWITLLLVCAVVFSALYMLRFMQKSYFGIQRTEELVHGDINGRQIVVGLVLVIIMGWIGIYPAVVLSYIQPAAHKIAHAAESSGSQL